MVDLTDIIPTRNRVYFTKNSLSPLLFFYGADINKDISFSVFDSNNLDVTDTSYYVLDIIDGYKYPLNIYQTNETPDNSIDFVSCNSNGTITINLLESNKHKWLSQNIPLKLSVSNNTDIVGDTLHIYITVSPEASKAPHLMTLSDGNNLVGFPVSAEGTGNVISTTLDFLYGTYLAPNEYPSWTLGDHVSFVLGQGVGLFHMDTDNDGFLDSWNGNLNDLKNTDGYWINISANSLSSTTEGLSLSDSEYFTGSMPITIPTYFHLERPTLPSLGVGNMTLGDGNNLVSFTASKEIPTLTAIKNINSVDDGGLSNISSVNFILGQGVGLFNTETGWTGNLNYLVPGKGYWINISSDTAVSFNWGSDFVNLETIPYTPLENFPNNAVTPIVTTEQSMISFGHFSVPQGNENITAFLNLCDRDDYTLSSHTLDQDFLLLRSRAYYYENPNWMETTSSENLFCGGGVVKDLLAPFPIVNGQVADTTNITITCYLRDSNTITENGKHPLDATTASYFSDIGGTSYVDEVKRFELWYYSKGRNKMYPIYNTTNGQLVDSGFFHSGDKSALVASTEDIAVSVNYTTQLAGAHSLPTGVTVGDSLGIALPT